MDILFALMFQVCVSLYLWLLNMFKKLRVVYFEGFYKSILARNLHVLQAETCNICFGIKYNIIINNFKPCESAVFAVAVPWSGMALVKMSTLNGCVQSIGVTKC